MVTEVKKRIGYDNSLDVFGVHGMGGFIGAIMTGVFATRAINPIFKDAAENHLPVGLVDGNAAQIFNQLVAIGITIALAVVGTFLLLKVVDFVFSLRVSQDEEILGLDLSQHGEEAYILDLDYVPGVGSTESHPVPSLSAALLSQRTPSLSVMPFTSAPNEQNES